MAHCSLLADHPQRIGRRKICLHIIIGAITEPLNNFFAVLQASVCCLLKITTVSHSAYPCDCCDWCIVANRFALLCHNIIQIRLNRVTHLLSFYLTSSFEFSCAVMSWGIIRWSFIPLYTVLWPSTGAYVTAVYLLIPCLVSFPSPCREGHLSDLIKHFLADSLLPCGLGKC